MRMSFHGGAGTVTGSRHLLETQHGSLLVDAGMFQGLKELRKLNWKKPAFDPRKLDVVLLTHTHIDHAGYLPRLVKEGYRGPVYCTRATADLASLLLLDSAKIQEEDAAYANKKGFSRHKPALPLYTAEDVEQTLDLIRTTRFEQWIEIAKGCRARFVNAGHILGSAMVHVEVEREGGTVSIVFSGDVGRYDMPLHVDPEPLPDCDVLVVESTYGNRDHDHEPLEDQILEPFEETFQKGGVVLIPSFAVGRAQQVTLILRKLMEAGRMRDVPIHIDSPMAVDATLIYEKYCDDHNLDECTTEDGRSRLFPGRVQLHKSVSQSKRLNAMKGPRIIISASGMLSGGRILHHLARRLPDPRNLLCLVGYQAAGTRGRRLLRGEKHLRIHGRNVEVRSRFLTMNGLSGHADRGELLRWIRSGTRTPGHIFVTHGEPKSASAFARLLRDKLDCQAYEPKLGQSYDLDEMLEGARKAGGKGS